MNEAKTIEKANAQIAEIEAAGHQVRARMNAQGVELEIIRRTWGGLSRSYQIIPFEKEN